MSRLLEAAVPPATTGATGTPAVRVRTSRNRSTRHAPEEPSP
ncbi:hypothetical protein [Streptomyces sp. NPDC006267]